VISNPLLSGSLQLAQRWAPQVVKCFGHAHQSLEVHAIEAPVAVLPDAQESCVSKDPEMLTGRGLPEANERAEFTDAPFAGRTQPHEVAANTVG
jgi:hypothetical protein